MVILDVASRAVLGYTLALGREYTKDDVVEAIQAALVSHRPRALRIPGLCYNVGGGFPSAVYPELAYACWDGLRFDNAKANLAEHTLRVLAEIIGCWPDAGPPGEPNERPFVERFFHVLAAHFAHRLPGTTGSHPQDIKKVLADPGTDVSMLIRLDELEELIDVIIANYNGEAHDGLGGRTPLEALGHFVRQDGVLIRSLARTRRDNLCLLQEARTVTVRGKSAKGARPHINFEGVRYSSDVLAGHPALIAKQILIYYNVKDLRTLRAFFADGAELGILTATRPWAHTTHSLRLRKEILRLRRMGKLRYADDADPVEAYIEFKRKQAHQHKRAANDYARAKQGAAAGIAVASVPTVAPPDVGGAPSVKPLRIKRTIVF